MSTTISKKNRAVILANARESARIGNHLTARAEFAKLGISYVATEVN